MTQDSNKMNKKAELDPFKILILFFVIFVIILFGLGFFGYVLTKQACEDEGMKITGQFDCRKGNEYYEVYNKDIWGFDKGVNKYPKTEQ